MTTYFKGDATVYSQGININPLSVHRWCPENRVLHCLRNFDSNCTPRTKNQLDADWLQKAR